LNNPKLSVIIPTYNRSVELRRALISLELQTVNFFEVIVVDDGSTEDIKSLVDLFKSSLNIKYLRIKNSGGPARPRNFGIRAASSDWISFLDSDDWWFPGRISKVLETIAMNDGFDIFYHQLKIISTSRSCNLLSTSVLGHKIRGEVLRNLLIYGNALPNSSVVVNKKIFDEVGWINESPLFSSVEDFDFWLLSAKNNKKFFFINKILGGYWSNLDGISSNPDQLIIKNKRILDKYAICLSTHDYMKAVSKLNYLSGSVLYSVGRYKEALIYLNNSKNISGSKFRIKRYIKIFDLYLKDIIHKITKYI